VDETLLLEPDETLLPKPDDNLLLDEAEGIVAFPMQPERPLIILITRNRANNLNILPKAAPPQSKSIYIIIPPKRFTGKFLRQE